MLRISPLSSQRPQDFGTCHDLQRRLQLPLLIYQVIESDEDSHRALPSPSFGEREEESRKEESSKRAQAARDSREKEAHAQRSSGEEAGKGGGERWGQGRAHQGQNNKSFAGCQGQQVWTLSLASASTKTSPSSCG